MNEEDILISIDLHTLFLIEKFNMQKYSRKEILNLLKQEKVNIDLWYIDYYFDRFFSNINSRNKREQKRIDNYGT